MKADIHIDNHYYTFVGASLQEKCRGVYDLGPGNKN